MIRRLIYRILGPPRPEGASMPRGDFSFVICTAPMEVCFRSIERMHQENPEKVFVLYAHRQYAEEYARRTGLPVVTFDGEVSWKNVSLWKVLSTPGLKQVFYLYADWWHNNVVDSLYYMRRILCPELGIYGATEFKTSQELYYSVDFQEENLVTVALMTVLWLPLYLVIRAIAPVYLIRFKCFDGAYGDFLQEALSMNVANRIYKKKRELYVCYARRKMDHGFVHEKTDRFLLFWPPARYLHLAMRMLGGYNRHTISEYELRPVVLPKMGSMPPCISLTRSERSRGNEILAGAGVGPDQKIICVHVRDSAFFREELALDGRMQDAVAENRFRDWSGKDIIPFARRFRELGYLVIKMGTKHPPMPSEAGGFVFDYANSSIKSPFMDCYLAERCEFYLSSDSGPSNMANFMQKPLMLVNMYNLNLMLLKHGNGVYLKRFVDIQTGRELCLSELCERRLHWQRPNASIFLGKGVSVENNSPEEILQCAEEMLARVKGSWEDTPHDVEMRKKFNMLMLENFRDVTYGHKYYALEINAPISTTFLRNRPEFIQ